MRSFVREICLEGDIHVCIIFIVDEQKIKKLLVTFYLLQSISNI